MANIRGGVFTLRTASRLKKDDNWFALSDVWITSIPPIVTSGLVLNLDAGNTASYPGSGIPWGDLSGISGISTATGALPIYNTTDNGVFKTSGTRTDANASSLVLALPMDGANNGTTFTDQSSTIKGSGSAKTVTAQSDAKTLTAQSKFYGSSGYLDGTGDAITVPAGTDFAYGTGNFTIEGWFYQTREPGDTGGGILWSQTVGGRNYFVIFTSSSPRVVTLIFGDGGGSSGGASSAYSLNTWNHFAVVRSGTSIYTFINGVGGVTGSCSYDFSDTSYVPTIGRYTHADAQQFQGYLQDFRVYKGLAKYTANFTPPIPNNGTLINGPTYSSANNGAIVFDGTNDYVSAPAINLTTAGTVSAWFYKTGTGTPDASNVVDLVSNVNSGGTAGWSFGLNVSTNKVDFYLANNGSFGVENFSTQTILNNTWYNVVVTYNGSNKIIYINGVQDSTFASSVNGTTTTTWSIGARNTGARNFQGNISQALIYTRALSAAEISQNFNALASRFGLEKPVRYSDGISPPNTGYFGGGSGNVATMDKVTYSSDTTAAVPGANLSLGRRYIAATGNTINGYFGGGITYSTMDKVTYATDTTAAVPGAALSAARYLLGATGNLTNGYFGGGNTPGFVSTMDKITYSTDTRTTVAGANLSSPRGNLTATGNSTNGYFGGGNTGAAVSTMDKVTYATDTTAAIPGANLSIARYNFAATGNSTNGYFGGGYSPNYSTMDKVTYSSDTTAAVPGANLSVSAGLLGATGNSTNGYFAGSLPTITTNKVTYSSDTTAVVPGAALSSARYGVAASSARANALPFPPAPTPTPTTSLVPAPNTGYFGGGGPDIRSQGVGYPGPTVTTIEKVSYATDTTARVPGANLSVARGYLAATGNSTNGYFGGGGYPTQYSTMDKVTYSSDTTAVVPGANLTIARFGVAATANSTNGYFGGGGFPSFNTFSTMDKVTYSSDTTAAVPGANLTFARGEMGATGNSTAGYFGGGAAVTAQMDKVTYSSDTTAVVPGAALSLFRRILAATGNSTAGYFGGGEYGGPNSKMDKLTYSSDTTAAVPGANLSVARQGPGATGNSTAGYFGGGGLFPGALSTMDKVSYSTDTTAAVPGANLSVAREGAAATGPRANALPGLASLPNIV